MNDQKKDVIAAPASAQPADTAQCEKTDCSDGGKCGVGGYCKGCPYAAPSWDHEEVPDASAQPDRGAAQDERTLFMLAIDSTYPIPNTPHQSVAQRAMDNREAFGKGWDQARAAAAPSDAKGADAANAGGLSDEWIDKNLLSYFSHSADRGKHMWACVEDIHHFAHAVARKVSSQSATSAADAKDAARYRWMRAQDTSLETQQRDKGIVNGPSCYHEVEGIRELKWGDDLDAAIDAAMAAAPSSEKGDDTMKGAK